MATVIATALPFLCVERDQNVLTLETSDGVRFMVTVVSVFTPVAIAESGFLADVVNERFQVGTLNWSEANIVDTGGYLPCGCHGSQKDHTCTDVPETPDTDGDEENEPAEDPSSFDGGYGPHSYHARAMRTD